MANALVFALEQSQMTGECLSMPSSPILKQILHASTPLHSHRQPHPPTTLPRAPDIFIPSPSTLLAHLDPVQPFEHPPEHKTPPLEQVPG